MARDDRDNRGGKSNSDFPTKKIISCPIRLSYPYFFDPRENDQGKEYWETEALIPPTKEGKAFRAAVLEGLEEVMTEAFGREDEWPRGRNDYHPTDKVKYVDPEKIPGPGINEDWTIIRARSYQPPGVVDANKDEVLNKREVYGGRWARLSLTLAAYDSKKSKGVTIYLNNAQLLDNAESFGGRPNADQDFDRWDGEELESGSRRERDRDDRGSDRVSSGRGDDRGRDREDSRQGRDRGSSDRGRSRDDGRGDDRARSRQDRDERDTDQHNSARGRDTGRSHDRDTDRDARGDDRGRDNRVSDRDRGRGRDGADREASRDGGRSGRGDDDRRGGDRDDRREGRGREDDRDRDTRSDRGSRDARDDDRGGGRSRDREDDRDREDRRPSRGGRDDREEDDRWS